MPRTLPTAVVALAAALVAGTSATSVGTPTTPAPTTAAYRTAALTTAAAGTAPVGTVVMIIRHAEKPKDTGEPGVDETGKANSHALTKTGWTRARGLVGLFSGGRMARPRHIYAAGQSDDAEGLRTRETVQPLSAALGVPVDTSFVRQDEGALAARVASQAGPTLISWQHNGIPDIAAAFPGVTPTPPGSWPDSRYDMVWTFTKTATGWHFVQGSEHVMPNDR